jgi:hypothetical protein
MPGRLRPVALLLTWLLSLLVAGQATFYNPGIAEQVLANRLAWGHVQPCGACIGYVALLERETVGELVWLQRPGQPPEGPFLVIDCAAAGHQDALRKRGWVVDVDWQTAQRWQMRGPVPVTVLHAAEREPTCRMEGGLCD